MVEATRASLPAEGRRRTLLADLGLDAYGYVLATIHRPENADPRDVWNASSRASRS